MAETEALYSLCESQTLIHQLCMVGKDEGKDSDAPERHEVIFGEEL